jgi:hypothetical protein
MSKNTHSDRYKLHPLMKTFNGMLAMPCLCIHEHILLLVFRLDVPHEDLDWLIATAAMSVSVRE